jgi:putative MATE family efflux protein
MKIRSLFGDRAFYRSVLAVALPMMIQTCITNLVNMLDNVMVGSLSTEAMSGVAIVNQFIFIFNLAIFGAVSAAGIFTAQFHGGKDHESVKHTFRMKIIISLVIAAICMAVFLIFDDALIASFLHEGGEGDLALTMKHAKEYLLWIVVSFIPFAIAQSYASTLRETGESVVPMISSVVSVLTNLVFNALLIFGLLGFPALGVAGAAIATALSRFVDLAILAIYAHTHTQKAYFARGAFRSLYVPRDIIRSIAIKGVPIMANELLWSLAVTLRNQCYSTRGLEVVAAINIAVTMINLLDVIHHSLASSVAIVLGNLLGAGKIEESRDASKKLITFAALAGVLVTVLQIAIAPVFPYLYNTEDAVREMATEIMITYALFIPFISIALSSYYTLRSGGKVITTFLFDCGYAWCAVLPVALVLTHFTDMSIIPLYALTYLAESTKCIPGLILVGRGKWARQLVARGESEADSTVSAQI